MISDAMISDQAGSISAIAVTPGIVARYRGSTWRSDADWTTAMRPASETGVRAIGSTLWANAATGQATTATTAATGLAISTRTGIATVSAEAISRDMRMGGLIDAALPGGGLSGEQSCVMMEWRK